MAHCYFHALSSVRKWGGKPEDYLSLHQWFDQSKAILADPRHRALRHHAEGIFMLEALFGATIVNADGRIVPVRLIGEQHVREDLGSIPSFADWARLITPQHRAGSFRVQVCAAAKVGWCGSRSDTGTPGRGGETGETARTVGIEVSTSRPTIQDTPSRMRTVP